MENNFTPEQARQQDSFTEEFICHVKDNTYNIRFHKFQVRDLDTNYMLFEVSDEESGVSNNKSEEDESDNARIIKYHLGPEFLELRNLGTCLTFSVGKLPVKNLLMIERHYFKGKLIKSFEFKFDFCIPNSTNTWETIYNIPELDDDVKMDMINSPWETKSDSFYFIEDNLNLHHKALYMIVL
jgi:hypothetical protein